ncbi:MAG: NAD(P)H-dependent glycerol-3-phosphate dehydrogenase [candidate division Zixibacteria bacterium]|nr:NAD(P)H-dependent glycerol-3-phosphate dehydrogenase [candidate division Zixibacteria bacterium]
MTKIAVLGAGSWGIAVAVLINQNGYDVNLWEFFEEDCAKIQKLREQPDRLPGIKIPEAITITNDIETAVTDSDAIVLAVPSQVLRATVKPMVRHLPDEIDFVISLAKGIENNTLNRMSEVLLQELPGRYHNAISTLSGPSHAEEVSRNIPTTVVVAADDIKVAESAQKVFSSKTMRVYTSTDLIGVELGGSLKNVVAIAAGISYGLELGDNTIGALITRGLAEMARLGQNMGADPRTFAGLSGIGDLITTCTSRHSRNRFVGEQLGKGRKLAEILESMTMVAEGVKTTQSAYQLSQKHAVEMPITTEVYNILFDDKDPKTALYDLMTRTPKPEIW